MGPIRIVTLPFRTVKTKWQPFWRPAATLLIAACLWWGAVDLSGVSTIRPGDDEAVLALAEPLIADGDWPGWRGGDRQGTLPEVGTVPLQWSLAENGAPRSLSDAVSPPCVVGSSLFVTREDRSRQQTWLTCLDRTTGQLQWCIPLECETGRTESVLPTPASDGSRVFVTSAHVGALQVVAYSFSGKRLWTQSAGPIARTIGPDQSPVVSGAFVYVAVDQKAAPWQWNGVGGFVTALHRQTGQIVWRTPRSSGEGYATPVVATMANRRQLVLPGRGLLQSYDAETGQELWRMRWSARVATASVVCDDQYVFATTSGTERETICVRADGDGDVNETHVLWRAKYAGGRAAPILVGKTVVVAQEDGGVTALDRSNGRVTWQQRLSGHFSTAPLCIGSRLYCWDDNGGVSVLDADHHGQLIAHSESTGPQAVAVSGNQWLFVSPSGLTIISPDGPTQIAHEDPAGRNRR